MTSPTELRDLINSALGKDALVMGSDPSLVVQYIPTGIFPIDSLLGGGLPMGRWVEIYGDYSTLKSYIAYMAMAGVQERGGTAVLVDSEHSYQADWYSDLGGDPKKLIVIRPEYGEKAVMAVETAVRNGADLVVWDSIASTQPKASWERSPDDTVQPARLAAMMSEGLRRMNAANSNTAILCLNQTRINVGITFGSNEAVPGGKSLPFYSSFRLSLRKAGKITEDVKVWDGSKFTTVKQRTHVKIKATLEKSKLSAPDREVWMTFDLRNACVDEVGFILGMALEGGVIGRTDKGRWSWQTFCPDGVDAKKTYTEKQFRAQLSDEVLDALIEEVA